MIKFIRKFIEDVKDGIQVGKRLNKERRGLYFLEIIDLKKPLERWEYKFYYMKYKEKYARDRENEKHSYIWDTKVKQMLTLDEFIKEADDHHISARYYCSASHTDAFVSMGGSNIHMSF